MKGGVIGFPFVFPASSNDTIYRMQLIIKKPFPVARQTLKPGKYQISTEISETWPNAPWPMAIAKSRAATLTGPSSGSPAGTDYREGLRGDDGGVVTPVRGGNWPFVDCNAPAPVTIDFTAGWQAREVPSAIIHAILFAVADAFEMCSEADLTDGSRFDAREALISSYRLTRLYA